ncbi:MAG: PilZ domain-containing protein [Novosphingobium sp.]|nr:PilZ domain-containing protein [Novosphingobium sp.]
MSPEEHHRRSERHVVDLGAHCRTQSGLRDRGRISNISLEGCCVVTNALFVKVGIRVLVKPDGMEGLTGMVRWIDGTRAGIEFDMPLYPPVVDYLAERFGTEAPVTISPC